MLHESNRYKTAANPMREGRHSGAHLILAEQALGRRLPRKARVHHLNGVKWDNRANNLVICEDEAYHRLLHQRQVVFEAGGDPNTQIACKKCGMLRLLADIRCSDCFKKQQKADREQIQTWTVQLPTYIQDRIYAYLATMPFSLIERDEVLQLIDEWRDEYVIQAEEWFMSDDLNIHCLMPTCGYTTHGEKNIGSRGLCRHHYQVAYKLVLRGKTTWDELIRKGRCNPSKSFSSAPPDIEARDWFLADVEMGLESVDEGAGVSA